MNVPVARCTSVAARSGRGSARVARDDERSVPERHPGLLLDHRLGGDVDAEQAERGEPRKIDPAMAGLDVELRRQVLAKDGPMAMAAADRQLADHRPPLVEGVARPQLGVAGSLPGDGEHVVADRGGQPGLGRVGREVGVEQVYTNRAGANAVQKAEESRDSKAECSVGSEGRIHLGEMDVIDWGGPKFHGRD